MSKKHTLSKEMAKNLSTLGQLHGVVWPTSDALYLLEKPSQRPPKPRELALALCETSIDDIDTWATVIGAKKAIAINPFRLSRWSHRFSLTSNHKTISALAKEGWPALRKWRNIDIHAWLEERKACFAHINRIFNDGTKIHEQQRNVFIRSQQALFSEIPKSARGKAEHIIHLIAMIYGQDTAIHTLTHLCMPHRKRNRQLRFLQQQFEVLRMQAEDLDRIIARNQLDAAEKETFASAEFLQAARASDTHRTRLLVAIFMKHLPLQPHPSARQLKRALGKQSSASLRQSMDIMWAITKTSLAIPQKKILDQDLLALSLVFPATQLKTFVALQGDVAQWATSYLCDMPDEQYVQQVWRTLIAYLSKKDCWDISTLITAKIPSTLLQKALLLDVIEEIADAFVDDNRLDLQG